MQEVLGKGSVLNAEPGDTQPGCGNLFVAGEFTAHSGSTLPFKIDCDALTDGDLDCLARQYVNSLGNQQFGEVCGVPRGGERFASAIRKHVNIGGSITWQTNLIVDDVLTTGKAMREFYRGRYPNRFSGVMGVVIFARGPCPDWITPLFTFMPQPGCRASLAR